MNINDLPKIYTEGKRYRFRSFSKSKGEDNSKTRVATCVKKHEYFAVFDFGKYLECMSYLETNYEIKEL